MHPTLEFLPRRGGVRCTHCGWETTGTGVVLPTKKGECFSEFVKCPLCGADLNLVGRAKAASGVEPDLLCHRLLVLDQDSNAPLQELPRPTENLFLPSATREEVHQRYLIALKRLREEDRKMIIARVELGADWRDIADACDKPSEDAARIAVARALRRLATEMAREDEVQSTIGGTPRPTLRQRLLGFVHRVFGIR